MDEAKSIRQMSPDEVYEKYTKPYWLLFLIIEFIVTPVFVLICFHLIGYRPSWLTPMLILYLAIDVASVFLRGRSLGGIRFR